MILATILISSHLAIGSLPLPLPLPLPQVYSVCEHGPTSTLITNLKPLLEKYEAHMISGHDHCQEHIQETGESWSVCVCVCVCMCMCE